MSSHNDSRPEESDDPIEEHAIDFTDSKPNTLEISGQYHPTAEQLKVRKPRHRRSGSHGSGTYAYASPRISPMRERRVSAHSPRVTPLTHSPRRISQGSFVDFESNNNAESSLYPNRLHVHRQSWNGNLTTTSPDLARRNSTR